MATRYVMIDRWSFRHLKVYLFLLVVVLSSRRYLKSTRRPECFQDNYPSSQPEPSSHDLKHDYGLSVDSRGMSLMMVEYVLRVWLWVAPIKPIIDYISPGGACMSEYCIE